MEPTDMHRKHTDADAKLSGGVHRVNHPDQNFYVPEPVWATFVGRLGNFIRYLREVGHKPNKRAQSGKPDQPVERHVCRLNPGYTCACPGRACAADDATYRHARGPYIAVGHRVRTPEPNKYGNFRCPVSGLACDKYSCREWCEGSGEGSGASTETGTGRSDAPPANNH